MVRKPKYTNEELIEVIKAKTEELGRAPKIKEISQRETINRRFGSWNKALEQIGHSKKSEF